MRYPSWICHASAPQGAGSVRILTQQGRQIFTSCESSPGRSAPQKRGPPDSASGQKKIGIVCKSFSAFYRKKSCLRKDTTSQAYSKISFLRLASFPQSGEARAFPPLPRLLNHSCCLQVKKLGDIYYNKKGQVRDTTHTCPLRLFKKVLLSNHGRYRRFHLYPGCLTIAWSLQV